MLRSTPRADSDRLLMNGTVYFAYHPVDIAAPVQQLRKVVAEG